MSKPWIDKMFAEYDDRELQVRQKREKEQLRQEKIDRLAPTIWREIDRVLSGSINAFNQRSPIRINMRAHAEPYTLELQAANAKIGFIVSYDTVTGVLSYGNPFDPESAGSGTLLVKIDPESHYTIHDPKQSESAISIEDVDELILGDFMKSLIKPH